MSLNKKIKSALISVFYKDGLDKVAKKLSELGVQIYSTGGTQKFLESVNIPVVSVESLTTYPSILGGRIKTLHPKVFGGILARREMDTDIAELSNYDIPEFDMVIVDLYPFEETVAKGGTEQEIIEKIDIGGISLIRAAAKNYKDVLIISHKGQYEELLNILENEKGSTSIETRRNFAREAFNITSHYDTHIFNYFADDPFVAFKQSEIISEHLRYGENPHQKAIFWGNFNAMFDQLHGKEISYNNLLDIDAAVNLISDFKDTTFAVLKHNNACGLASREKLLDAWTDALAGDPVSAFGGIVITNVPVDVETANEVDKIFFEVIIAPAYSEDALSVLKKKKNRRILIQKNADMPKHTFRTALNGVLFQDKDLTVETEKNLTTITAKHPTNFEIEDLLFANKLVKHTKSNSIVLAKGKQLYASGTGQTSRVDALKQAIEKAKNFGFNLHGAVMASDAFFPFKDCVEIAHKSGITAVIQPGGSIRDQESIDFCNANNMSMVFTRIRHFKH